MRKTTLVAAGLLALSIALLPGVGAAQSTMIDGQVTKIDESAGKITLKHGPIKKLDMDEAMTMVFRVQDPAMLKQVKVGDKVKFDAERVKGQITVTKIEKSK
jgi:Cu(I)/Ag(I) efflux system protein CusF